MDTSNAAPRGSSINDASKPKPVARLEPRRVELVRSTYQPSKAELGEPITRPQVSLEDAPRRLIEPVAIHPIIGARARRDAYWHHAL